MREENGSLKSKLQETQQEMDDLLVCLAEQDQDVKRMRDRLRQLGDVVRDESDVSEQGDELV